MPPDCARLAAERYHPYFGVQHGGLCILGTSLERMTQAGLAPSGTLQDADGLNTGGTRAAAVYELPYDTARRLRAPLGMDTPSSSTVPWSSSSAPTPPPPAASSAPWSSSSPTPPWSSSSSQVAGPTASSSPAPSPPLQEARPWSSWSPPTTLQPDVAARPPSSLPTTLQPDVAAPPTTLQPDVAARPMVSPPTMQPEVVARPMVLPPTMQPAAATTTTYGRPCTRIPDDDSSDFALLDVPSRRWRRVYLLRCDPL